MGSQAVTNWKEWNINFKKMHTDWAAIGNICSYSCKIALSKEKNTQNMHKVTLINMQQLSFGFVSS